MVQHAGHVDEIETAVDRGRLGDVGLGEFDIVKAESFGHALGVAEAGETQVDGEDARVGRLLRKGDGRQPGAAAGNQHVGTLPGLAAGKQRVLLRQRRLDPARVGVLLILLADRARHLAVDLR